MEPSTISGFSVDGSALGVEPSMMRGVFVEGSGLGNGTLRDMEHYRGRFASEIWTVCDIESPRGRLVLFTSNCP